MTKRQSNKYRICRQLGEDIWGTLENSPKKYKVETSSGEHGKTHRKVKDLRYEPKYLTQLREKQKIKKYYGELSETQFSALFERGMGLKGEVFKNIFSQFERRLDATLFRMGFVSSVFEARQFVSHGHVYVNNIPVTIASYQVKDLDVIEISNERKNRVLEYLKKKTTALSVPPYIEVDVAALRAVFLRAPEPAEIPYKTDMNIRAVIEYYSR